MVNCCVKTRLESLFSLLEDGTSTDIRENAAKKIGQVAQDSPTSLPYLIGKIRSLIFHKEWETRIAAAKTMRYICKSTGVEFMRDCYSHIESENEFDNFLSFDSFNIKSVLTNAAPLLKSGGMEYKYEQNLSVQEQQRNRARQRKLLIQRIRAQNVDDVVKDIEMEVADENNHLVTPKKETFIAGTNDALQTIFEEGSEISRKRKRDYICNSSSSKRMKHSIDSIDATATDPISSVSSLCIDLFEAIFDASWETRHGAGMCLREMFLQFSLPSTLSQKMNIWIEECVIRTVAVLSLDHYGDYSSDGLVAPVREVVAQVFGYFLGYLEIGKIKQCLTLILQLLSQKYWHVCHGGLLGVKNLLLAHPMNCGLILPIVYDQVVAALSHSIEDIQIDAANILGHFSSIASTSLNKIQINKPIGVLWKYLEETVGLQVHMLPNSFMHTLGKWYGAVTDCITIKLESKQVVLAHYLFHSIVNVRKEVVKCLLLAFCSDERGIFIDEIVFSKIFHCLVVEGNKEVRESLEKLWQVVVTKSSLSPSPCDKLACVQLFNVNWFKLILNPNLTSEILTNSHEKQHHPSFSSQDNLGIELWRANICNALGYLISAMPLDSCSFNLVNKEIARLIHANSWKEINAGLLLIHCVLKHSFNQMQKISVYSMLFRDEVLGILNGELPTNKEFYSEHLSDLGRFKRMYTILSDIFLKFNLPCLEAGDITSESKSIAVQCHEIAKQVCCLPFEKLCSNKMYYELTHFKRQDLFKLDEEITRSFEEKDRRIHSLAASCYLMLLNKDEIPLKLSPVLQALMQSVKCEPYYCLQEVSCKSVADFVVKYFRKKKKCCGKLVNNLCNNICAELKMTEKVDEEDCFNLRIKGSKSAMLSIVKSSGSNLFESIPSLLTRIRAGFDYQTSWSVQLCLESCVLIKLITSEMDYEQPHNQMIALLPLMAELIQYPLTHNESMQVKQSLGEAIALLCKDDKSFYSHDKTSPIIMVYELIFSTFEKKQNADDQKLIGACVTLSEVVKHINVIPYVPSLLHYAMQCMNESNSVVHRLAAQVFSQLVPLISLHMDLEEQKNHSIIVKRNRASRLFLKRFLNPELTTTSIPFQDMATLLQPKFKLRDYQQRGVDWLAFLASSHIHGILADDMGLGKTIQVLCAIALYITANKADTHLPSIIVCPSTIVSHWQKETNHFKKSTFSTVLLFTGLLSSQTEIEQRQQYQTADLIITSYHVFRKNYTFFSEIKFGYCVLDEGHEIRNPNTKLAKSIFLGLTRSHHRLIVTGTPIQNSVSDLWALMEFLMPGYLGDFSPFKSKFIQPIHASRSNTASATQREIGALALTDLHGKVLPFILRRTKAKVLAELPPKVIQDLPCEMTSLQAQFYKDILANKSSTTFQSLHNLRRVCVHPALVHNTGTIKSRLPANIRELHHSGKFLALKELLVGCGIGSDKGRDNDESSDISTGQHRILIFAQLKESLSLVEQMLRQHMPDVSFLRLDGTVPSSDRYELSVRFNSDPTIDLMLLTTSVGGLGLNLTGADIVIFLEHSWNPYVDLQSMDRAHRIGQKQTVQVFRLISKGTIEEDIMNLQLFKKKVSETVVEANQSKLLQQQTTTKVLQLLHDSSKLLRDDRDEEKLERDTNIPTAAQNILVEVGEMWDEKEYESLQFPSCDT